MAEHRMPLSFASAGKMLTVIGVNGGRGLQRRLADMGLIPGVQIIVMNGYHPGPMLIAIRGSRLSLSFGVAQKIMVKEADNGKADCCRPGRQP